MTIHHATLKKAAANEINLTESTADNGHTLITAEWEYEGEDCSFSAFLPAKEVLELAIGYMGEGVNPGDNEEGEEEEEVLGSVVKAKYKEAYRERGNANHCGDWLSKLLEGNFDDAEGKFDIEKFQDFLTENEVVLSEKVARMAETQTRGWKGRFRMSARIMMERTIAAAGYVMLRGDKYKMPNDFRMALAAKHKIEL